MFSLVILIQIINLDADRVIETNEHRFEQATILQVLKIWQINEDSKDFSSHKIICIVRSDRFNLARMWPG